ncbi:MAG: single-stranded DNA-binding protein [Xanthomonadales bacterium]|nr:single-stranded DNA-binding protein [Xanthomonadales bacterium]
MATTEQVKTADGSKEVTEWHNCALWVKSPLLRSYYEEHLVKGAGVDVEGKIAYEKFVDGKGQEVTSTGSKQALCKCSRSLTRKVKRNQSHTDVCLAPVQPRPETSTHAGFSGHSTPRATCARVLTHALPIQSHDVRASIGEREGVRP